MQQLAARLPEAEHFIECAFDKGESPRGLLRRCPYRSGDETPELLRADAFLL